MGLYPVKATAALTGLSAGTLRAWERRHAAVVPHRDAQGRRQYDEAMLERLALLHRLTDRGHPISRLAPLGDAALIELLEQGAQRGFGAASAVPGRMLAAVAEYRVDRFDRELATAIASMPLGVLLERVVQPLLREVGQRWVDGRMAIAQERLVSSLLRARLLSLLSQHPRERPPQVLFATLPGEQHELGLIGAALQAHDAGLPVMYLGTELPARELAEVANQLGARALALSSVYPGAAAAALEGLRELDRLLAPGVPVWLGGTNARYLGEELGLARISVVNDARQLDRLAARLKRPARTPGRTPSVPGPLPPPPRGLE